MAALAFVSSNSRPVILKYHSCYTFKWFRILILVLVSGISGTVVYVLLFSGLEFILITYHLNFKI